MLHNVGKIYMYNVSKHCLKIKKFEKCLKVDKN